MEKEKIYLKFSLAMHGKKECAITKKTFKPEQPFLFLLDGDENKPVKYDIALKQGFTMTQKDFKHLREGIISSGWASFSD